MTCSAFQIHKVSKLMQLSYLCSCTDELMRTDLGMKMPLNIFSC